MSKNYDQLADQIIEDVDGKENISNIMHCMTRLRFNLKDNGAADIDAIKKLDVYGAQFSGDQLQVIIGNDVSVVYDTVCKKTGFTGGGTVEAEPVKEKKKFSIKNVFSEILNAIVGAIGPLVPVSEWSAPIDPQGLRYAMNWMNDRYHLPQFIVENGLGAEDIILPDGEIHDEERISYLKSHIEQMEKAVNEDGIDVIGYTPWGIIDLISASTGEMKKRYGMIYVDRNNDGSGSMQRRKKESFEWYGKIISNGGI